MDGFGIHVCEGKPAVQDENLTADRGKDSIC